MICGFTLCITRSLFYHYFGKKAIAKMNSIMKNQGFGICMKFVNKNIINTARKTVEI